MPWIHKMDLPKAGAEIVAHVAFLPNHEPAFSEVGGVPLVYNGDFLKAGRAV